MASVEGTGQCPPASPGRISFSAEFLDDSNFISICPKERERIRSCGGDFEFLSGEVKTNMITADELISEGKLLPFWKTQPLHKLNLKSSADATPMPRSDQINNSEEEQRRISWFLDDDPSPRPPKCTVLWKELLRLKKQRSSTLSPSEEDRKKGGGNKVKKGFERNIRIRPMINVPICTAARTTPPRRGGRLET